MWCSAGKIMLQLAALSSSNSTESPTVQDCFQSLLPGVVSPPLSHCCLCSVDRGIWQCPAWVTSRSWSYLWYSILIKNWSNTSQVRQLLLSWISCLSCADPICVGDRERLFLVHLDSFWKQKLLRRRAVNTQQSLKELLVCGHVQSASLSAVLWDWEYISWLTKYFIQTQHKKEL